MNKPDVPDGVGAVGCGFIFRGGCGGLAIGHAEGRAYCEFRIHGLDRPEGLALREVHNVGSTNGGHKIRARWRMYAAAITEENKHPRLVEDAPVEDAVAECAGGDFTIIREASSEVAVGPSPGI